LGNWTHPVYGEIKVTKDRVKRFSANINNKVRGADLDIDYEHKVGPDGGKAAGWIVKAEDRGDKGLYVRVSWTKKAKEAIKDKEYRYFSPEYLDEWKHPSTGKKYQDVLCGGALTNRPFLKEIAPINLADYFDVPSGKFSQDDANYRDASSSTMRCSNCALFRSPNSCLVVAGRIDGDHISDYFRTIYNPKGGLTMFEDEEVAYQLGFGEWAIRLRDISTESRIAMAKKGWAIPIKNSKGEITGGRYPIENIGDLKNAIRASGRGTGLTDEIKNHIMKRARALGQASLIPDNWKSGSKAAREEEQLEELLKKLREALGLPEETDEAKVLEAVGTLKGGTDFKSFREALGLPEDADESKILEEVTTLKGFKDAKASEEEKATKFAEEYPEEAKRLGETERRLTEEANARKLSETEGKIAVWSRGNKDGKNAIPPAVHESIKEFRLGLDDEQATKFDEFVSALNEKGLIEFKEKGSTTASGDTDPDTQMVAEIEKKMEENDKLSYRDAMEKVLEEHPEFGARNAVPASA